MSDKETLLKEWIKFKKAEDAAKEKRISVEESLVEFYPLTGESKSKTFQEDDFTIETKRNIRFTIDQKSYTEVRKLIPPELRPEKVKFELDEKGFRYLMESSDKVEHEFYILVSDCVTEKEGKRSFTISKK